MKVKKKIAGYALTGMVGISSLGATTMYGTNSSIHSAAAAEQQTIKTAAFDDITGTSLETEMRAMIEQGILFGYKDGTYAPNQTVTRGQFAAFIARALDLTTEETAGFTDVPASSSLAASINAVAEAGLIEGYTNDQFGMNDSITREQMAQVISNALNYLKVPGQGETAVAFTDEAEISSSFQAAVERLSALGIIKGVPNLDSAGTSTGTVRFDPKGAASRAQAAAFISRMFDVAEQREGTPPSMPDGAGPGGGSANVDTESIITDVAATLGEDVSVPASSGSVDEQATELAQAFLSTLSDEQAESIQYELTAENAAVWSNLPVGAVQRNGILLGSLSEESLQAFKKLLYVSLGEEGYAQMILNLEAEEVLGEQADGYDADLYYVSLLGEVSDSSTWILQFGGHHYANNFTFNAEQTGATPFFIGLEPQTFETADGETVEPLAARKTAMYSMIDSLSDDQEAEAEITEKFDDVLVGPGNDGGFPAESEGVLVSSLSEEQQELVKEAIRAWVSDVNEEDQKALLDAYFSEEAWAETYIAWSGSTSPEDQGSYIRIDGPRVWIEFTVQGGIVYRDQVHFHTIWRDKTADYGGELSSQ